MATNLENLEATLAADLAEQAALNSTKAGGLPNSQASGVNHAEYAERLQKRIIWAIETMALLEGPFEEVSEAIP